MVRPHCFIIGAQKAGTTFLASMLDQSPDVCVSDPKEPHFFSNEYEKGFAWYQSIFYDLSKALIEASTTYSVIRPKETHPAYRGKGVGLSPEVIKRMKDASPDARIIYLLRHPVDRTYSSFLHRMRFHTGKVSLQNYFEADPMMEIGSRYSAQIERYQDEFPDSQILCLRAEDLYRDPLVFTNKCLSFLDLAKLESFDSEKTNRHKGYVTSGLYNALKRWTPIDPMRSMIEEKVGHTKSYKSLKNKIKSSLTSPPPEMTQSERSFLFHQFSDEIDRINELTGISFSKE